MTVIGGAEPDARLADVLFETSTIDPLTFAAVLVVLLGAALLASWLPARRAAALPPTIALRNE